MKSFKLFLVAAVSLALLAGCEKEKDVETPFTLKFSIDDSKIVGGKLDIGDNAYNNYVILNSNTNEWEVDYTPAGSWIKITKLAEGEGNGIKVEATENTGFDMRTATVTFKYDARQIGSVEVRQAGSEPILEIDESSVAHELPAAETTFEVVLNANVEYAVSYEPADMPTWIGAQENGGGETRAVASTTQKLEFTALANETGALRSGKIVFSYGDISREVYVVQNEPITMTVIDPAGGSAILGFEAGTLSVTIATNSTTAPAITALPSWLAAVGNPSSTGDGLYTYGFSYAKNSGTAALTGTITFFAGEVSESVTLTQNAEVTYTDPIKVVNAAAVQPSGIYSGIEAIYNGILTDNWDSNFSAFGETVTLTFELEDADRLSKIVYYKKGGTDNNAHSMTGFELLASDTADGTFVSHGIYEVEAAVFGQPREIMLTSPIPNPKFVRMVVTVPANGWFTCAEMQFFQITGQDEEFVGVSATNLPSGVPATGNFVPAAGSTYSMTVTANVEYEFECSAGIVVAAAHAGRALAERTEKTWNITVPANRAGVWKQHTIYVKAGGNTVAAYTIPQAFDISKASVTANSDWWISAACIMDVEFTEFWESNWGFGTGYVYAGGSDVIRDEKPVTITITYPEGVPAASKMTICPRGESGDWTKFTVTAKTAANPAGTVVCSYDSTAIETATTFDLSPSVVNITELFINITGTNSGTTAAVNEVVIWQ